MAEKKNNLQPPKMQNTTQIDTDVFVKGMIKDPNASITNKENWTHARNAINNSDRGDTGTIGNEPANLYCATITPNPTKNAPKACVHIHMSLNTTTIIIIT